MTDPSVIPLLAATLDNTAPIAGLDTETYYDKVCSVKELGAWAYARHPDWDCYLLTVARKTKEGIRLPTYIGAPEHFPWKELHGYRIYSHNAGFDQTMYRRLVELGKVPDIEPYIESWACTADFAAYYCGRRSLHDAVQFCFGRHLSKAVRDDAKGKRWPKDFTAEEQEAMLTYGGTDADECLNLGELAQEKWPVPERLLSQLNREQGMRGVRIDVEKLNVFLRATRQRLIETSSEIPWVAEGMPPTSPKAFAAYCRDKGIPPPPVKAQAGEEAYLLWEGEYGGMRELDGSPVFPPIKAVVDYRSISKVIKQMETVKERLDDDGVFRFSMKYYGASTGRFSGDAGYNMQNILKSSADDPDAFWVALDAEGELTHAGSMFGGAQSFHDAMAVFKAELKDKAHERDSLPIDFECDGLRYLLLDLRSLIIADKGCKLVIADSSQIEPRCLAFLTKDHAFIKLVRSGVDIYEAHARLMHGFTGPIGHLKYLAGTLKDKAAASLRARCKAERLGLGYMAGPVGYRRAAAMLAGLVLSEEEALDAVQKYREANPHVVKYWRRLGDAFDNNIGKSVAIPLPSGRRLYYRNLQKERKLMKDKNGEPVWREQTTAEIAGVRSSVYGGRGAENCSQSMARDVFCEQLLMLWEEYYADAFKATGNAYLALQKSLDNAPRFHVHDELIFNAEDEKVDEAVARVHKAMTTTPKWAGDTPFACEHNVSEFYLK